MAALQKCQLDFHDPVDTSSGSPLDGANHQPLTQVPTMGHSDWHLKSKHSKVGEFSSASILNRERAMNPVLFDG